MNLPAPRLRWRGLSEEENLMEVSNSTGQNTGYTVRTGGAENPGPQGPGKKGPQRRPTNKRGKLLPRTYEKVTLPPGTSWKVEFHDEKGALLAATEVQESQCMIVLVQERDGSHQIHCLRSATATSASAA
jgi:hypothetical protein